MKTLAQEKLKSVISRLQAVSQYFKENFDGFEDELIIFNGQVKNIWNLTNDFDQMSSEDAIKALSKILREQKALKNLLADGGEHFAEDIFYIWKDQITVLKQVLEIWKQLKKCERSIKKNER